ncbi:MAG: methyltransferase domain-containing protein [Acidimicrobiales bacterium]|nr:methyltransferase domain-containing protein [Acidimicrobiales bacterium]
MPVDDTPEATRLEQLWSGTFGDDYVERNLGAYDQREPFWTELHHTHGFTSALEIGCNVGGNLQWIAPHLAPGHCYGIDINAKAIAHLHQRLPGVNAVWSPGRELPFRDRWFDLVFTMGVLIHQPEATLPLVMAEMVRASRRWVLMGEYYAATTEEVPYRGVDGALFRRDYGAIFASLFPDHRLAERGFLGRDTGWDDITWWLFERG